MAATDSRTAAYGRVYRVTNLTNGKSYVGKTKETVRERWQRHCNLRGNVSLLQKAIAKYGAASFRVEEIATAVSKDALNSLEREWIQRLSTLAPNGYNLALGGEGGSSHASTRAKLSAIASARWARPEFKEKMRGINSAAATPETTRLRRENSKKAWSRPEHREAVRVGMETVGRAKLSLASKAAWANPDYRARVIAATKAAQSGADFLKRRGEAISAALATPAAKEKRAAAMKVVYSNPEFLRRRALAISAGHARNKAARNG